MQQAAWLYNRLPNAVSGLTPIKILMGTCSNHTDLLHTNVWGCPVYMLDPQLQDGKEILKWNCHACQGQFLGFLEQHSSLIATI